MAYSVLFTIRIRCFLYYDVVVKAKDKNVSRNQVICTGLHSQKIRAVIEGGCACSAVGGGDGCRAHPLPGSWVGFSVQADKAFLPFGVDELVR